VSRRLPRLHALNPIRILERTKPREPSWRHAGGRTSLRKRMGDADRFEAALVGASVTDPTAARLFALWVPGSTDRASPRSLRHRTEVGSALRTTAARNAALQWALSKLHLRGRPWRPFRLERLEQRAATSASTMRTNAEVACAAATALASGAGRQMGGRSLPCSRYDAPWRVVESGQRIGVRRPGRTQRSTLSGGRRPAWILMRVYLPTLFRWRT
jgi:hypothetical protein